MIFKMYNITNQITNSNEINTLISLAFHYMVFVVVRFVSDLVKKIENVENVYFEDSPEMEEFERERRVRVLNGQITSQMEEQERNRRITQFSLPQFNRKVERFESLKNTNEMEEFERERRVRVLNGQITSQMEEQERNRRINEQLDREQNIGLKLQENERVFKHKFAKNCIRKLGKMAGILEIVRKEKKRQEVEERQRKQKEEKQKEDETKEETEEKQTEQLVDKQEIDKYKEWFEMNSKIPSNFNFSQDKQDKAVSSITGKVQGGKTDLSFRLAHKSIMSGTKVIYLILPKDEGKRQTENRLKKFNEQFEGWCIENELEFKPIDYGFIADCGKNIEKLRKVMKKDMIIAYSNVSQLDKLLSQVNIEKFKFNLITDEVDDVYKEEGKEMTKPFKKICEMATNHIGLTATSLKFWYKEKKVEVYKCFRLEKHKNYKGIGDVIHYPLSKKDNIFSTDKNIFQKDYKLISYIKKIGSKKDEYVEKYGQPVICLYVPSKIIQVHNKILEHFQNDPELMEEWVVIRYDGNGESNVKLLSLHTGGKPVIVKKCLADVLTDLKLRMHESGRMRNIMIVSGTLADRQVSFVDSDYEWHLSHQRVLFSKGTDCTNKVQSMRLLGIFNDEMPLTLTCRKDDYDDIKKYKRLQRKAIVKGEELEEKVYKVNEPLTIHSVLYGKNRVGFSQKSMPKSKLHKDINKPLKVEEETQKQVNEVKEAEEKYKIVSLSKYKRGSKIYQYTEDIICILIELGCNKFHNLRDVVDILCKRYPQEKPNSIRGSSFTSYREKDFNKTNKADYTGYDCDFLYDVENRLVRINQR